MKYVVLAGVLIFTLCAGVCEAEAGAISGDSASAATAEETESDTGLDPLDPDDNIEEPVAQVGVMSPGESYDDNTGLPDVVESDSSMDVE